MAWNRTIELEVGKGGSGLLISDLDMSFEIIRSRGTELNTAKFSIYNAKEDTRNKVLSSGNNVVFKAGHLDEKNIAAIFFGTILKSATRKEGSIWITDIECMDYGSNKEAFQYGTLGVSYKEKTNLNVIISDFAGLLNVPVSGLENASVILNNGFVYSGTINGMTRKIRNILKPLDIFLWFDNNEMILYNKSSASVFDVVNLSTASGLITSSIVNDATENDDKKRIEVLCVLNPKLRPQSAVRIDGVSVNGVFIIDKAEFFGDNFGGDFTSRLECVE